MTGSRVPAQIEVLTITTSPLVTTKVDAAAFEVWDVDRGDRIAVRITKWLRRGLTTTDG